MAEKENTRPLKRFEAQIVAEYLREKGVDLPSGWVSVWKMTPAEVAKKYRLTEAEIIRVARRETER